LTRPAPGLVPWAWGIYGCASVIAAVMASLLAMHIGFTTVLALALGFLRRDTVPARPGPVRGFNSVRRQLQRRVLTV